MLLARKLKLTLEGARFEEWLMPVNQFQSPHLFLGELVSLLSFASVKDYDDYVTRLRTLPAVMDSVVTLMKKGSSKGLMPPSILLRQVSKQAEDIASPALEASPFAAPLQAFPASVPEAAIARAFERHASPPSATT